jgi:hypothetical protein
MAPTTFLRKILSTPTYVLLTTEARPSSLLIQKILASFQKLYR